MCLPQKCKYGYYVQIYKIIELIKTKRGVYNSSNVPLHFSKISKFYKYIGVQIPYGYNKKKNEGRKNLLLS